MFVACSDGHFRKHDLKCFFYSHIRDGTAELICRSA